MPRVELSSKIEQARLNLSTLESLLLEHSQAVQNARTRCSRVQEEARVFISRELACLSSNATALARMFIAGGATPEYLQRLISADREPFEKKLYPQLHLKEADDLAFLKRLDEERAAVEVLREAILLEKSRISDLRKDGIAALNRARADEEAKLARAVLEAVHGLSSNPLMEQNRQVAEELQPTEVSLLEARPVSEAHPEH